MEVLLFGLVAFVVVGAILESPLSEIVLNVREDRKNRNDRGKGKRPSEKYVTR